MAIIVPIAHVAEYTPDRLVTEAARVLEASNFMVRHGDKVLVKPNLVNSSNARHCTTHPQVVRAACMWLLDHGAKLTVGDSPAFGPASHVAQKSGLKQTMAELGLPVTSLRRAAPLALTLDGSIGLSEDALEADHILNLPKFKVHCQMTMSGAVKNLFGCVVGFRKALAHNRLGHSHDVFSSMLMDVFNALPQAHHLIDGVHALHRDGPINGVPFPLGWLGACDNGIALDTAMCTTVGLTAREVPLWQEALRRHMEGADPEAIHYPMERPGNFDTTGFEFSAERELSFAPSRLIRGRIRSILKHLKN